ncbi:hypothetical protein [Moorena producens]|nr:hypothetical protein [Moorena producens]
MPVPPTCPFHQHARSTYRVKVKLLFPIPDSRFPIPNSLSAAL